MTQCCACLSSAAGRTLTSLRPISRCNSAGIKPANLIVGTASSFGLSQSTRQRYYNVIGLAHSADATVFADLVELAYLLSAVRGRREFAPTIPLRFTNSYSPHDEELTKRVLDTSWLTDAKVPVPSNCISIRTICMESFDS